MSAAATHLGMSQPSLSRAIAELEHHLGQPLFVRHARGVRTTALGQTLVDAAERVEVAMLGFQRLARGARAARGTVRIAASEIIGTEVIVPALRELRAACPELAVELVLDNRPADLVRGEADVAVRMFRPTQGELVLRHVADLELGLYASDDYLRRRGSPSSFEELLRHDLVGFDPRGPFAQALSRVDPRIGTEGPVVRSDSLTVHLLAARHGAAIAALQCPLARRYPELRRVLPTLRLPPMEAWLVMHRDLRRSAPVRTAYDWLAEQLVRYAEGGE